MLKALLLLLLNLALAGIATTQTNLVLNGSFEDTISCGEPVITIRKAAHWYTANSATPDVWDADLDRGCGAPLDPDGFPGWWYIAPFDGLRHAGEYFWFGPGSSDTREYMMTSLVTPLAAGTAYEVSLACALSGTMEFAVDHIGVWIGTDSLYEPDPDWLNVVPQIKLRDPEQPYLAETETWTLLKDTLVAAGGERWLVIGNFDVADAVDGISAYPDALNPYAYYYIDSVAVREVELRTGMRESSFVAGWAQDGLWLRWSLDVRLEELQVVDACGRTVAIDHAARSGGFARTGMLQLAPGVYIIRARVGGQWSSTRIIREEEGL